MQFPKTAQEMILNMVRESPLQESEYRELGRFYRSFVDGIDRWLGTNHILCARLHRCRESVSHSGYSGNDSASIEVGSGFGILLQSNSDGSARRNVE